MNRINLEKNEISGKVIFSTEKLDVEIDERKYSFKIISTEHFSTYSLIEIEGKKEKIIVVNSDDSQEFLIDGQRYSIKKKKTSKSSLSINLDTQVTSPMPGKIIKIYVKAGESIKQGDPLVVLEAMKMEHTLKSPRDAKVLAVNATVGELVQGDFELISLDSHVLKGK